MIQSSTVSFKKKISMILQKYYLWGIPLVGKRFIENRPVNTTSYLSKNPL